MLLTQVPGNGWVNEIASLQKRTTLAGGSMLKYGPRKCQLCSRLVGRPLPVCDCAAPER